MAKPSDEPTSESSDEAVTKAASSPSFRLLTFCGRALMVCASISLLVCLVIIGLTSYRLWAGTEASPRLIMRNSITYKPPVPGIKRPYQTDDPEARTSALRYLLVEKVILSTLNLLVLLGALSVVRRTRYTFALVTLPATLLPCCGAIAMFPLGAICAVILFTQMRKQEVQAEFHQRAVGNTS